MKDIFPEDIIQLFHLCLTTSYFQWNHDFYEQLEGVAMGSPLSPVVANFFKERFENDALTSAIHKPSVRLRYVDDTFVIWSHGREKLDKFLNHINTIHPNIQFTMETEKNRRLSFLDVLITRAEEEKLEFTVYRKPTHTDRYLHRTSNYHPRQKRGIIKTLKDMVWPPQCLCILTQLSFCGKTLIEMCSVVVPPCKKTCGRL